MLAALVLLLHGSGAGAAEVAAVSPWSLADEWGQPGSPGWSADARANVPPAWGFLGLRAGGFAVIDPLPGADRPAWGLREGQAPAAWYDSVAVTLGEHAAWRGWNAPLVTARGILRDPAPGESHARVAVAGGGVGLDRDALDLVRAGPRSVMRFGTTGVLRDPFERYGLAGQHLWFISNELRTGAQTWSGAFAQRGLGNQLAPDGEPLAEGGRGESGRLGWGWNDSTRWLRLRLERSWDERQSVFLSDRSFHSRRDAQSTGTELETGVTRGGHTLDARFEARRERVRRSQVDAPAAVATDDRAEWWWAAIGWRGPVAGGQADAQLGGGWHGALRGPGRERQLAPGVSWTRPAGPARLRVFSERLLAPQWHDRAAGVEPFLQSAWAHGTELELGSPGAGLTLGALHGRVSDRAIQVRYPLQDIVLRTGVAADAEPYRFTQIAAAGRAATGAVTWRASGWSASVRGSSPQLEPESGARADATLRARFFKGDLGVTLRGGGAWVGAHDLQPGALDTAPGRVPGFATAFAELGLTLADLTFVLRGTNLEDAHHPLHWVDPATLVRARSAGRQVVGEVTWRFHN